MQYYEDILKRNNLKATQQRMQILKIIDRFGHISIETLIAHLKDMHSTVSLNTIYVNLEALKKENIITELAIQNKKKHFEITKDKHIHLICNKCDSILDKFIDEKFFTIVENEINNTGFKPTRKDLSVYGLCESCK